MPFDFPPDLLIPIVGILAGSTMTLVLLYPSERLPPSTPGEPR